MQCTRTVPGQDKPRVHVHPPFPGSLNSICAARTWTTKTLTEHGVEPPEGLDLVVSELATNAVTHTHSGTIHGRYTLRIAVLFDRIRVEVRDAGPLPGRYPTRLKTLPHSTHGRGLALVEHCSLRWGRTKVGTGVWAEVAR